MRVGPKIEARAMTNTITIPKTASLFFSSRRHASRHNDVLSIGSDVEWLLFRGKFIYSLTVRENAFVTRI